ncbi:MAG: hypothetical protein WC319_03115 [Candidatus Paceibacterota bacterium]
MSYQPEPSEVFYCGHCERQYSATGPVKCPICGKTMVSWRTNRESHSQALDRWKWANGK